MLEFSIRKPSHLAWACGDKGKKKEGTVAHAKFKGFGCDSAFASSSLVGECSKGGYWMKQWNLKCRDS